jgi:hypothetical protein
MDEETLVGMINRLERQVESDAKVIAAQDNLLARAADMLNVSEHMVHMDLGSEITQHRRKFLATNEQTAGEKHGIG